MKSTKIPRARLPRTVVSCSEQCRNPPVETGAGRAALVAEPPRSFVANEAPPGRVVFFRQQPHVVTQIEKLFEEPFRFLAAPRQREVVHQPEATGEEGALTAGHAVERALVTGAVAAHEAVLAEFILDGR